MKPPLFEIIAGSYEEFLLGYNFLSKENSLIQSFAAHDHSASVRCVAFSGHYLASGGADDRILIYDLKTRKQHQTLTHHDATISCLAFTENTSHLISGSMDGVLAVTRIGNWQVEKIWDKAHKGSAVLDVAIHSSGKLALSLGADCTLCTWNLVKGRQAYVINLKSKCKDAKSLEKIIWAPDGIRFILYGGKYTEFWSIDTGSIVKQIQHKEKVTAGVWIDDKLFLAGHEDGQISVVNLKDDSEIEMFKAHESRVKSLALYKKRIVSISSNGQIKVWNKSYEELAVADTGCRLTCLCIAPLIKVKEEKTEEVVIDVEKTEKKDVGKAQVVVEEEEEENPRKRHSTDSETISKKKKKSKKQ